MHDLRPFVLSRRTLGAAMLGGAVAGWSIGAARPAMAAEERAEEIGGRRELFVEHSLVERLAGEATWRLGTPTPRDVVLVHDAAWEGSGSGYHSVFQDGDRYRMYYKAWQLDVGGGKVVTNRHPLYCCYAESADGKSWTKPELGLHEFEGSTKNNIVLSSGKLGPLNVDAGHPAVFRDENPQAPPAGRYKAIVRSSSPNGLLPFQSPDGLKWTPLTDAPILSGLGAFDSQNLAFWDPTLGKYRAYWRIFTEGVTTTEEWRPAGLRAIRTATSDDLVHWSTPTDLTYEDSPPEQLYTNQVKPYHRAPHLLLGLPTRYLERAPGASLEALPESDHRRQRSAASQRYGTALTEALLMGSRDGVRFRRWNEAFLRPGIERPGTWNYGQQYLAWHIVETASDLAGAPNELSLYASENYWTGTSSELRRYTLRLDGFVSAHGSWRGGELVTTPVRFTGTELSLNFATSAAGSLRVELQTPAGEPLAGYSLDDCQELFGDTVERSVRWKDGADLAGLQGRPVRLRFVLRDADLYSYQFV